MTFSEKTVCAEQDLSRLDDALAAVYKSAAQRVPNQEILVNEQKHWIQIRDLCKTTKCLRQAYESRIKELENIVTFTKKNAGRYLCTGTGTSFEIRDGVITDFYAQTAVEGEDFANGYTLTCVQHINMFTQVRNERVYELKFTEDHDQYGESTDCRVLIQDLGARFHVHSTNCISECMQFDFKMEKTACARLQ